MASRLSSGARSPSRRMIGHVFRDGYPIESTFNPIHGVVSPATSRSSHASDSVRCKQAADSIKTAYRTARTTNSAAVATIHSPAASQPSMRMGRRFVSSPKSPQPSTRRARWRPCSASDEGRNRAHPACEKLPPARYTPTNFSLK
jgi:hypothetical protein